MATIKLPDGQTFEYPDEIAQNDDALKDALASIAPDVRNAKLTRTTVGGVLTVNVVKQAGTKSAAVDERLSFDQSYEENRAAFIGRLVRAGWTGEEASAEWDRVQFGTDEG